MHGDLSPQLVDGSHNFSLMDEIELKTSKIEVRAEIELKTSKNEVGS